jgi:hypothetical protein
VLRPIAFVLGGLGLYGAYCAHQVGDSTVPVVCAVVGLLFVHYGVFGRKGATNG